MFGNLTYLTFELLWATPILALQWIFGWRTLWSRRRILVPSIAAATAYLSVADGVAIGARIWRLHQGRIIGAYIGNVPIEEVLFFLFTNALVIQAILLLLDADEQARARDLFASLRMRLRRVPSRP